MTIEILSLGAGVQSSCLALMAAKGEVKPMPLKAIFADTGDEPKSVYKWLAYLEKQLPFPVVKLTQTESLSANMLRLRVSKKGNTYMKHSIPFFAETNGRASPMMRQCTTDFKIIPILREIRKLKQPVIQWIGISLDEVRRMKQSRNKNITNRWPLVELRMSRNDCLNWLKRNNYPEPPRSACVYCPYHHDREWLRLQREEPQEFKKAIEFEFQLQDRMKKVKSFRGTPFLHKSLKPLSEVDFDPNKKQMDLFNNDCSGMCGN